jgi:hypothetical protein
MDAFSEEGVTVTTERFGPLVVSLGAERDLATFETEIRDQIERKRREGVYSDVLLSHVIGDPVHEAVLGLQDAAQFNIDPPLHPSTQLVGRARVLAKRSIAKALRWHTRWQVGQTQTFAAFTVAALSSVEARLADHDRLLKQGLPGSTPSGPESLELMRLPSVSDPELRRVVEVLNENLRRLEAAAYGRTLEPGVKGDT